MKKNDVKLNRLEKIARFFLYIWIFFLIVMIILNFFSNSPNPNWFRTLMWTMFFSWIILIIPTAFSIGYMWWNKYTKKISDMSDEKIIEFYKNQILIN